MAGDLISLLERIAHVHADSTFDELEQARAARQERAARDAVRPRSPDVTFLGGDRPPINKTAPGFEPGA